MISEAFRRRANENHSYMPPKHDETPWGIKFRVLFVDLAQLEDVRNIQRSILCNNRHTWRRKVGSGTSARGENEEQQLVLP